MLHYGSIIGNTIKNFRVVEKNLVGNLNWHCYVPLWHNMNIMVANRPLDFQPWASKGVTSIGRNCVASWACLAHLFSSTYK